MAAREHPLPLQRRGKVSSSREMEDVPLSAASTIETKSEFTALQKPKKRQFTAYTIHKNIVGVFFNVIAN